MNMECRVASDFQQRTTLRAIADGWADFEYWTPCDTAPLLAKELIARVEAPHGSYYFELTEKGRSLLEQGDAA